MYPRNRAPGVGLCARRLSRVRGGAVPKTPDDETIIQIEETQAALRDCIARAKSLADDSERLIQRHKGELSEPKPPNPAG